MQIVEKLISELQPYDSNPRKNDAAVPYVTESIKKYGFKVPIVIDADGVIVAGHTRYLASIELGLDKVPCIVADDLTEEQIREFRLVDNKAAEYSSWDYEPLIEELEGLDFGGFDFGFPDAWADTGDFEAADEVEHEQKKKYRIIVTCTDQDDQMKLVKRLTNEGYECEVIDA